MRTGSRTKAAVTAAAVVLFFAATAHAATTKSVRVMFEIPSYVRFHDNAEDHRRNDNKDEWKEDKEKRSEEKEKKDKKDEAFDTTSNCNWKVEMKASYDGRTETSETFRFEPGDSRLDVSEEMKAEMKRAAESVADGTNEKKVMVVKYTVMTE